MKYKTLLPTVPVLIIAIFLLLFLYYSKSNSSFLFDSLAYPGHPAATPPQAYPGPEGFTLPSPTPTTLLAESYLEKPPTRDVTLTATLKGGFLLTSTFTPWPTPSPNLTLAGTPYPTTMGTPDTPVPRQGVPSSVYDTLLHNNRYILGDWTFVWGPALWPSPNLEQVPMIAHGIHWALPSRATVATLDSGTVAHEYWLVYNECEHQSQCDASPEEAAT